MAYCALKLEKQTQSLHLIRILLDTILHHSHWSRYLSQEMKYMQGFHDRIHVNFDLFRAHREDSLANFKFICSISTTILLLLFFSDII